MRKCYANDSTGGTKPIKSPCSLAMRWNGGRNWIRTSEGVSQQIYSLPPLATWVSYQPFGGEATTTISLACQILVIGRLCIPRVAAILRRRSFPRAAPPEQSNHVFQRTGSGRALKKLITCSN